MTDIPSETAPDSSSGNETLDSFLAEATAQVGDSFRMGAEARVHDSDPDAFDSSELVQWAAGRAGVTIRDGSWNQYHQLYDKGATLDIETALDTPGALVFRFPDDISDDPNDWDGRPSGSHVAISLGDGRVLEATTGGVRIAENGGRFTHGGSIPEITGTIEAAGPDDDPEPSEDDNALDAEVDPQVVDADVVDEDWAEKALDLRKQALDKNQEAEAARTGVEAARDHREVLIGRLEDTDVVSRDALEVWLDNSGKQYEVRTRGEALTEQITSQEDSIAAEGEHMDPDALEAAKALLAQTRQDAEDTATELKGLEELHPQLEEKWTESLEVMDMVGERLNAFAESFAELEAEAKLLSDEAQALRIESAETIEAALPEMRIKGSPDDVAPAVVLETLSGPVSPERLRQWLAGRNELARQTEDLAGDILGQAEKAEDWADSFFEVAGEARMRATAERAGIESDRALIDRLEVRRTEADALESRLADQVEQESAQLERLREIGDTAGVEVASEQLTRLLQRQFEWSGQASSIGERIEKAQQDIAQRTEDAGEYDQLAAEFEESADRQQSRSDSDEVSGADLLKEVDSDDFVTDKVEDALTMSDKLDLDLDFHLIDARTGTDLDIEMDRDGPPDSSESLDVDAAEPEEAVVDTEVIGVMMRAVEPSEDVFADPILTEAIDVDADPAADVEIPELAEIVVLDEDPPADEFQNQIDAADQFADSLEDLLDDQE